MPAASPASLSLPALPTTIAARVSQNTRYLLWRMKVPHMQWLSELQARLSGVERNTLRDLLTQGSADRKVVAALVHAFNVTVENLIASDLVKRDRVDVLSENLKYLLMHRGAKKRLAAHLQIDQTTVSRWLSGAIRPTGPARQHLNAYFCLPASTDLTCHPLFLLLDPPSLEQRKRWLQARIQELSPEELSELFPALRRMLTRPGETPGGTVNRRPFPAS